MKKIDIKKTLERYWRVLRLLKTPTREEIVASIKIAGGGILLVGLIGFIVWFILIYIIGVA